MKISKGRYETNVRWDRKNMTTVGCRLTKDKKQEFQVACDQLDTTMYTVLRDAVDDTIRRAKEKQGV